MCKQLLPWFILLVTTPGFSAVPGSLNLEQAVMEGAEKSPEVQRAEAASEEAGWRKTESLSGFLPNIQFQAEHFLNKKFQVFDVNFNGNPTQFPAIYPTTTAAFNMNMPLFDGLQNVYNLQSASSAQTAAEESYSWTQFQVAQKIRLNFLKALAAQDLKAVSEENLKTITDHLNQTQSLRRGGVATNYDVLRVEVQLSEAKSDLLRAGDDAILARKQLAVAMGAEDDNRTLEGKLPVPETSEVTKLKNPEADPGAFHRADIASLENQSEAASKSASAASTYLIPKISLAGNFTEYNDLGSSWTNPQEFRSAYNVGLLLTWNLFDGMASISRSKEAAYREIQAEKSLEQARLQVPFDFDFWKRRFLYSAALYQSKKADVQRSEESVRLARVGFRAGTRTSTEVLDAELDLFRARAGVVSAQIDCSEAEINLELALGRRL